MLLTCLGPAEFLCRYLWRGVPSDKLLVQRTGILDVGALFLATDNFGLFDVICDKRETWNVK